MNHKRIKLAVYVDLDPFPGTFHTADSAERAIRNLLASSIPHYSPSAYLESDLKISVPGPDMSIAELIEMTTIVTCGHCELDHAPIRSCGEAALEKGLYR